MRSTDVGFLELVRRYLGPFQVEGGPDDILFSADCGIGKKLAGGTTVEGLKRLFFQDIKIFRGTSMEEMAARLISGVRDWTNHQSNEFVRVRAGGVVLDGDGLLLPSQPEPHLTALVALLVEDGAGYVGDEIVNIDPVFREAYGTGLPLLMDAEDLGHFPQLGATPRRRRRARGHLPVHARPRWPVLLDQIGGSIASPAPIRWIVFPTFEPGARTELRPLERSEALFRFTQAGLNLHIWTDRALLVMRELLENALVGRLVIGSLQDGARWLLSRFPKHAEA